MTRKDNMVLGVMVMSDWSWLSRKSKHWRIELIETWFFLDVNLISIAWDEVFFFSIVDLKNWLLQRIGFFTLALNSSISVVRS